MFSVVVNCNSNGINNIYSQGSPDLILDFCTDYWNGKKLCRLTKNNRKKLLDLYQRFSASSYCTAFSYKPILDSFDCSLLNKSVSNNGNIVLKCPTFSCDKISNLNGFRLKERKFSNAGYSSSDSSSGDSSGDDSDYFDRKSLTDYDFLSSNSNKPKNKLSHSTQIENILELNSKQIFLGMASMQYKAKIVNIYIYF